MSTTNYPLHPDNLPFDTYIASKIIPAGAAACRVMESITMAKRILLQERVRDFTSADIVAVASLIEQRDRATRP